MSLIEHEAVVTEVGPASIKAKIVQTSACAGCNAKAVCNSAEKREIIVSIEDIDTNDYKCGDNIKVAATTSLGMQAVLIAFGGPFLIMVATCFVSFILTSGNEPLSALLSLLALVPAYVGIYFFRNKLKRKFKFIIQH